MKLVTSGWVELASEQRLSRSNRSPSYRYKYEMCVRSYFSHASICCTNTVGWWRDSIGIIESIGKFTTLGKVFFARDILHSLEVRSLPGPGTGGPNLKSIISTRISTIDMLSICHEIALGIKLLFHYQTSTVWKLKFGNDEVISFHTLQCM